MRPLMEIIRKKYQADVVSPQGYKLMRAEADTLDALGHELGGQLSQYTMEDGEDVPKGTKVERSRVFKFGPITVRRVHLGEIILVP